MERKHDLGAQLKLIAIVLPEPLFSFVREQQKYISDTWGCRHALRTPPHITIMPPLSLSNNEVTILEGIAKDAAKRIESFTLHISGYGAFKPRVVFLQPDLPEELLFR